MIFMGYVSLQEGNAGNVTMGFLISAFDNRCVLCFFLNTFIPYLVGG